MTAIQDITSMQAMILTDSQTMLSEMLQRYVADNRAKLEWPVAGRPNGLWQDFAKDLGILGLALTENSGGLACGPVETMLVVEQLGAGLSTEPYLSSAIVAAALLNSIEPETAAQLGTRIACGETIVATAISADCAIIATRDADAIRLTGQTGIVPSGAIADTLLVPTLDTASGKYLLLALPLDHPGMEREELLLLDCNPAARFSFANLAIDPAFVLCADAGLLLDRARDVAYAAHCAELVGIMDRMLQDTVAYTSQRIQFGQPLAKFQVLQHRMADMFVEIELARSMALMAALAVNGPTASRSRTIRAALAKCLKGARIVAHDAVQLHGGIGTTDELVLSRYFKRVRTLASLLGTADSHVAAIIAESGGD